MKDIKKCVKIKIITPVHIGNGVILQEGIDFVKDGKKFIVVDIDKALKSVGKDERKIQELVTAIERKKSLREIFPHIHFENVAKRFIFIEGEGLNYNSLKETIHDAIGYAYIPGSSIKGAIRSAILGTLALKEKFVVSSVRDGDKEMTDHFVGNPNTDFMRFIQVSDAYFEGDFEIAIKAACINQNESTNWVDGKIKQTVEAIKPGSVTEFTIKLAAEYNCWAAKQKNDKDNVKKLPEECSSFEQLFETINNHTCRLIDEEIKFWKKQTDDCNDCNDYLEALDDIKNRIDGCQKGKECILRVGFGSGWSFITGGWIYGKGRNDAAREIRKKPYYHHYPFPKSRRISGQNCAPLGFVKLSLK